MRVTRLYIYTYIYSGDRGTGDLEGWGRNRIVGDAKLAPDAVYLYHLKKSLNPQADDEDD